MSKEYHVAWTGTILTIVRAEDAGQARKKLEDFMAMVNAETQIGYDSGEKRVVMVLPRNLSVLDLDVDEIVVQDVMSHNDGEEAKEGPIRD